MQGPSRGAPLIFRQDTGGKLTHSEARERGWENAKLVQEVVDAAKFPESRRLSDPSLWDLQAKAKYLIYREGFDPFLQPSSC